jgi:hypothetical protein
LLADVRGTEKGYRTWRYLPELIGQLARVTMSAQAGIDMETCDVDRRCELPQRIVSDRLHICLDLNIGQAGFDWMRSAVSEKFA